MFRALESDRADRYFRPLLVGNLVYVGTQCIERSGPIRFVLKGVIVNKPSIVQVCGGATPVSSLTGTWCGAITDFLTVLIWESVPAPITLVQSWRLHFEPTPSMGATLFGKETLVVQS